MIELGYALSPPSAYSAVRGLVAPLGGRRNLPLRCSIQGTSIMSVLCSGKALSVAVLTVTMAVRAAYAAPTAAVAQVKAADCCARHCDHRAHPARPEDCCQVLTQATDAALLTITPSVHHPGADLVVPLRQTLGSELVLSSVREHVLGLPRTGPPLFLAVRSLRL